MFQLFSINLNKKSLYKLFQIKHLLPIHLLPPPKKKKNYKIEEIFRGRCLKTEEPMQHFKIKA